MHYAIPCSPHTLLFWDVSWHLEGAQRMLAGGTYLTNLFDDNPPAVFAFYIPYAVLKQIIHMPGPALTFLYILLGFGISNYVSLQVLKNRLNNNYAINLLYFTSLVATLFIGITLIGQRENLMFGLTIPYIYMNLLDGYQAGITVKNPSTTLSFFVALLATIGFSQGLCFKNG